ncbi:hypothetical protein [Faecalibacterium prausnitzii]|uniref:Uncharacterized protein n=1 Tax=Faecalibacterium prausnitzii TaxID=853 RepID=A0A173U048_9FIRM|nr:hypothetical protein [Faecalibacterium prausnitzii]CUN08442.1 Uncharacterised protein [Faecalibacterium prausnitzii]
MKKWLIWCLTVLAMVCLIPGIVLKAAAETVPVHCAFCGIREEREARRYEKYDSNYHKVYVTECQNCHNDGNITHLQVHSGGTQGPTCTEGKICEKCGAEYGVLGHDWGAWTPNYASNGTHTRRCKRCNAEETGSCSGGYATCDTLGMCNTCGGSYYGGHAWGEWSSAGNGTHTRSCTNYCREVDTAKCTGGKATCSAKAVCEACGGEYGEKDPNNHALEQHAAKAPTCTEKGWNAYETCSRCDYTTYTELTALNHDLVNHDAKAPTCTEIGWDAYKTCSRCDHTTYAEQPALNHALVQHDAQAPTCTKPGWDAYKTCSRCDYTTTYQELPALNHDLVQHEAQAPTCTKPGWDAYETCSRCDHTTYAELPALNHDFVQHAAKAPTCTEKGWNAYETCSRCDYTTYAEQPALNHDLKQHAAKAPTCTEKGWNAYETCSRCDYTTYAEQPALNHDLKQHAAKAPTCTEIGWDAYETCSRCDYTTYAEQPALNHALVHHDAQAPTCTEKGWNAFDTCNNCNYTTYAELPALNHDYQAVTVEPTCETDGYTVFTCSRCKDSYTADPTDKLGHQFGAWSPNGTGSQSADCLRQGCGHTGSTDCRKFTFRTAEGETLIFCPVCGQAENAAQLEKIDAATAWPLIGSLSAEDVTARTNGEYLSVAFETAGSLTQPTGLVRLALPAGLLEGKTLVRIAPDGTQTEMPFETKRGKIILTLDFVNSELPVMLFRLVPQTAAL